MGNLDEVLIWLVPDLDEMWDTKIVHAVLFDALLFMALLYHTGYIGEFEIIDDHRAGKIVVNLTGRLNKVNVLMFFFPTCKDVSFGT